MGAKAVVPSSWNMPVCEKLAPRRDILIYALDLAPERRRPAPLGEPALDLGRVRHLRGTSGSRRWRVDGAHTAASVAAFAKSVKRKGRGVVLIIALRSDKNIEDVARAVREHLDPERVVCCSCGEGFVEADALASAFVGAEVASSPAAAFDSVPCDTAYVRVALGSFELAAAARAAWCV